jgi:hypothetical protein
MKIAFYRMSDRIGSIAAAADTFSVEGDESFKELVASLRPAGLTDQAFVGFLLTRINSFVSIEVESVEQSDRDWLGLDQ